MFLLSLSNFVNAQICSAGFTYTKEIYKCPPNYKCLVGDNVTVTFKADALGHQDYSWDFGDGQTGKGSKVAHYYPKPGEYKVTLKVFSPTMGMLQVICQESETKIVKIEDISTVPIVQPTCDIKPSAVMEGNILLFSDNRPTLYTPSIYEVYNYWTLGDGTSSDGSSGTHGYNNPGKYLVKYHTKVFKNMKGQTEFVCAAEEFDSLLNRFIPCYYEELCSKSDSFWVETKDCNLKPLFSVEGHTLSYHDGRIYLAAEGHRNEDINYWTFGDGTSASQFFNTHPTYGKDYNMATGKHTYKKPGKYLVTVYTGSFTNPLLGDMKGKAVCEAFTHDSLLHTDIPCYYGEVCRGKYQMWIEIPGDTFLDGSCRADIQISIQGNTIRGLDEVITTKELRPETIHYYWNLGDGSDTTGAFVTHTFEKSGKYLVSVTKVIFDNSMMWVPDAGNRCDAVTYDEEIRFLSNNCLRELCRKTYTQWVETSSVLTTLSPNPMENSGSISIENANKPVEFSIYNHAGQLMKSFEGLNNGKLDFLTHDLPIGIYLYTITSGGELIKKDKFSVMR
jgi:hypothetical protein